MIMSNVMAVALQYSAIDMVSGITALNYKTILNLGKASQEVKRDYNDMTRHI